MFAVVKALRMLRGAHLPQSLTESTDVCKWCTGSLVVRQAPGLQWWHFWRGSQRLLDQVGGESICFENLIYVDAVTLGLEEGSQSQWVLSLIPLIAP